MELLLISKVRRSLPQTLRREPQRGRTEVTQPKYTSKDWKLLFQSRALRYHYAGYAFFALAANSLSIWAPTFFTRVHGYSIATLGLVAGLTSLTSGISSTILGLSLIWIAPSMADVHDFTGPHLRGLGIGTFVCIVHITAYGIGSPLIGKLNDLLGAATQPGVMRYGFLVSPVSCIIAAILLWKGSRVLDTPQKSK